MLTEVICTFKLIQSQMVISQLHLLSKNKSLREKPHNSFLEWELGDCESNS